MPSKARRRQTRRGGKGKDGQEEAAAAPSTAGTAAGLALGELLEAFGVLGRRNAEDLISGDLDHISSQLQPGLYWRRRRGLWHRP
ncbi:hypothetical protein SLE2022_238310 [Rubroshorea leprosula]